MWYTYVLQSINKSFLYVGSTNDIQRRFAEHNAGKNKSTSPYCPFKLVAYVAVETEKQARSLEKYLKKGSGKIILKKRILHNEDIAKHEVLSDA